MKNSYSRGQQGAADEGKWGESTPPNLIYDLWERRELSQRGPPDNNGCSVI